MSDVAEDIQAPTYRSPLLERPGAVPVENGPDTGLVWHFGNPVSEQRRLEVGSAKADLSNRGVVRIEGTDRLTWLHSMTTQHLSGLKPYTSTESLVLSPNGHVEHDLHLVDDGTATWITVEPGGAPDLVAFLKKMQFMLRVEVTDVTDDWAVYGEAVDRETDPTVEGDPLSWRDPWPDLVTGGAIYTTSEIEVEGHPAWSWREVLVPRAEFRTQVSAGEFDGAFAGTWAGDALRVAAWRPRHGFETDHRTIPHELDWLRTAVHLQKGCYRGQETVARVHNLGRPPRRLVMLHLDGTMNELPVTGAPVLHGTREVGRVTTAARHHELGPVALAVLKRSTPPDAQVSAGGVEASQEIVVDAAAAPSAPAPKIRRLPQN
ncbi:CAF17-like 4Fe-4S cluster assembly/insertion protein YgfZ [Kineosporia succinea]|uniref:Folate-binding protein YgfZ n=1 Tax=Kineosporia succinea TaxID=84632 RepID=A0ABT9P2T4_9ACTN|nr:glycine cleavage T C-terminal barrel domain-containing protein [Kineosporia succinea]MDP9826993.1 folate-binding protein YgfZ [Kineosporia succinea]